MATTNTLVDLSRSRAIAVAGKRRSLMIYTLKPREKICEEVELEGGLCEKDFEPIREVSKNLFHLFLDFANVI